MAAELMDDEDKSDKDKKKRKKQNRCPGKVPRAKNNGNKLFGMTWGQELTPGRPGHNAIAQTGHHQNTDVENARTMETGSSK